MAKKCKANPMKAQHDGDCAFHKSPRCTATSKRTHQRCKAPATRTGFESHPLRHTMLILYSYFELLAFNPRLDSAS